jgi:hypothetical protein
MACQSLDNLFKGCDNGNVGGIKKLEVISFSDYTGTGTSFSVVIEFAKESGSVNQTFTSDLATGSAFVEQTVTVVVPKRDQTKVNAIKILGSGQRDLVLKVTDNNGTITFVGTTKGANLIKVDAVSGSKGGDANGYTLTFSAKEPELA